MTSSNGKARPLGDEVDDRPKALPAAPTDTPAQAEPAAGVVTEPAETAAPTSKFAGQAVEAERAAFANLEGATRAQFPNGVPMDAMGQALAVSVGNGQATLAGALRTGEQTEVIRELAGQLLTTGREVLEGLDRLTEATRKAGRR